MNRTELRHSRLTAVRDFIVQISAAICFLLMCTTGTCAEESAAKDARGREFFEKKIRPVLVQHCYKCHSHQARTNSKLKGGLLLDTRAGIRKGGESGPAIVPGKPDASLLIEAIRFESLKMPPSGKLPDQVIADIARWIRIGAPDPRDKPPVKTKVPKKSFDVQAARKFWAFRPPQLSKVPKVTDQDWPSGPIDRFVLAKLEHAGFQPSADADRHPLLRRVTFDLIGLPPKPKQIRQFVDDSSADAFQKVVDRLLESPHFGERWGRHWLDLTGYADTIGVGRSIPARHAWRYRDYVIDAFNSDKPYDRFVTEQIAGDLLPFENRRAQAEQISATGFLAIGPWELVSGDKVQLRMDVVDLQIDRIGQSLLGLTMGCARCHDHKFDPLPQADYYALAGILKSTVTLNGRISGVFSQVNQTPLPETSEQLRRRAADFDRHETQLAQVKRKRQEVSKQQSILTERIKKLKTATAATTSADPDSKPKAAAKQNDEIASLQKQLDAAKQELGELDGRIQRLEFNRPDRPMAIAVTDMPEPEDCRINIRGNARMLGDSVPRGFLRVVPVAKPQFTRGASGRLELAQWIVDKDNPLTARVFVNRVWHHLFGKGLVETVDNFGIRGTRPSHPELLDHLAWRLVKLGWSTKKLIREILLSRTYRMASDHNAAAFAVDPDNRLLWRMNRRRLEAETIRDAVLAISGELNLGRGGPSLPLDVPGNVNFGKPVSIKDGATMSETIRLRRTVYQPVKRKHPFDALDVLAVFDFPDPDEETGERSVTTVPTQALYLLNSPFIKDRARATALRLLSKLDKDADRVRELYLLVTNRPASDAEVTTAASFVIEFQRALESSKPPVKDAKIEAWARFCQAVLVSNEFLFRR